MASNCPNCNHKLKWYNIKAECPSCGVSMPNFNWEARLEEDNKKAEEKFAALYKTLNRLKFSVFGTRLRIARIAMSFIPAIGFILPWAQVTGKDAALNFDLLGLFTDGTSLLKFFPMLFGDLGGVISAMSAEGFSGPVSTVMLGFIFMLMSIVAIVAAFFLIFISFKNSKSKAPFIADIISIILALVSLGFFINSSKATAGMSFRLCELSFTDASAGAMWGLFVYIALLCVALTGNLLVSRSEVKSDEELEEVRKEKVRLKQEKAEQEKLKKEEARKKAEELKKQEQAEKVRLAKEALEKKNKK